MVCELTDFDQSYKKNLLHDCHVATPTERKSKYRPSERTSTAIAALYWVAVAVCIGCTKKNLSPAAATAAAAAQ